MTLDSVLRGCMELLLLVMRKRSFSCGVRNLEPRKKLSWLAAHYNELAIPFLASQVSRPRHICNAYVLLRRKLLLRVGGSTLSLREMIIGSRNSSATCHAESASVVWGRCRRIVASNSWRGGRKETAILIIRREDEGHYFSWFAMWSSNFSVP